MKNKKDRGCYAVGRFFERFRSEKMQHMTKKAIECVKSSLARKRMKDKTQLRPRHVSSVQRCIKTRDKISLLINNCYNHAKH